MERVAAPELMEDPGVDPHELAQSFDDLERANRSFGGVDPVVESVFALDVRWLLDIGCGSADIPRALLREARSRGRRLEIVALDRRDVVLDIARERTPAEPLMRFVRADARSLPFPDGALHLFDPADAIDVLREMRRVTRQTPIVCDVERTKVAHVASLTFARFVAKHRLIKHDAPLKVRRSYTVEEVKEMAALAGWNAPTVRRTRYFRYLASDDA
jgi:ubiquinone/menaquinone biosynthesis C-methylase UbiE